MKTIRVTLVGPLPPPMGGNTRHFRTLVSDLSQRERFHVDVIDTSRGSGYRNPLRNLAVGLSAMLGIARRLYRTDIVSYQASDRGMYLFGPIVTLFGKFSGTPVILRLFGGSFGDFYASRGRIGRFVIERFILSTDVVLLQTKRAIRQLEDTASRKLVWFSTYVELAYERRPDMLARQNVRERCARFVFLGHVTRAKGLEVILNSASRIPDDCEIDIFGPLDEYTAIEIEKRGCGKVRYCGFLSHAEVEEKLWEYDCLVLPTHYPGEGYPGVIAEALAHGVPVIVSDWMAIPEMVDEGCAIIVQPKDTDDFVSAINKLHLDTDLWHRMQEQAMIRARQYDHAVWSEKFEEICVALTNPGSS